MVDYMNTERRLVLFPPGLVTYKKKKAPRARHFLYTTYFYA